MTVPETPVDENYLAASWKGEIWLSREVGAIETESVTEPVRQASHEALGFRVAALDRLHDPSASGIGGLH